MKNGIHTQYIQFIFYSFFHFLHLFTHLRNKFISLNHLFFSNQANHLLIIIYISFIILSIQFNFTFSINFDCTISNCITMSSTTFAMFCRSFSYNRAKVSLSNDTNFPRPQIQYFLLQTIDYYFHCKFLQHVVVLLDF